MNGIILVNKTKGYTSRDVVNKIVKILNTKKVGHTGTLDPIATGVLVICVGSATKLVEILTSTYKEYEATVELGVSTDTLDGTGIVLKEEESIIDIDKIKKALSSFKCSYNQEVPIYSAVKINGKKLYEYARNGEEVVLPKRKVEIKNIELISDVIYKDNKTIFKFRCLVSKGTYIRSLIRDIATKLNTIGIMKELVRTKQGRFDISNCISIEELSSNSIIPIIDALDIKKVTVDNKLKNKILNGQILEQEYNTDEVLFVDSNNTALAIYKTCELDNKKIKPYKMLGGNII